MLCDVNNSQNVAASSCSNLSATNSEEPVHGKASNAAQLLVESRPNVYTVRPQDFAWLELSLVDEVERIFVDRESDKLFRVLTVVNERSPELRKKIYQREKAIIDALPRYEFDFHILARMGHDLKEVVDCADRPSYSRW
jgi:hypothetical protein